MAASTAAGRSVIRLDDLFLRAFGTRKPEAISQIRIMFEGKKICPVCSTPKPPREFGKGDMCSVCASRHDNELARIRSARSTEDRFAERLRELRRSEPAIPSVAEHLLEQLGGAEAQATRIAQDLKEIRGEGLTEEQKQLHTTHWTSVTKMHSLVMNILEKRDSMVGNHDPMDGMDERDLNAIVASGAVMRISEDADFRTLILNEILKAEPGILDRLLIANPELIEYDDEPEDSEVGVAGTV